MKEYDDIPDFQPSLYEVIGRSTLHALASIAAMQGLLSRGDILIPSIVAHRASDYADALLRTLEEREKNGAENCKNQ